ncbi:uncharacterized protein LOC126839682 [Adelges cooleyi]|uniref:uncharacterized protein LOC126839682 n=1 Tax=Adelges cooleyi TaxID=133065 RepID=UPI00217F7D13|nr:uncharacterized protein LOC126839682 [Adelges cooleyi]
MYLKSILFFCVASFFFQCQGVPPTEEQLTMIKEKIASKVGDDGKMDFTQLSKVLLEIGQTIDKNYDAEDMDFGFLYTNDQVEIAILSYTTKGTPRLNRLVSDIVEQIMKQDDYVKFDKIKAICAKVAKEADITTTDFASMDVFERLELQSNRMFGKDEVMTYALAFAATKEPGIRAIIKKEIQRRDGCLFKYYEDIIAICMEVKAKAHVPMEIPTYEQFIETWKNGEFTAKTAEKLIIRNFFF